MKFPSRTRQNKWLDTYIAPLFDLNLKKVMQNIRDRISIPDTRMRQIRTEVLDEVLTNVPLKTYANDHTHSQGGEVIRELTFRTEGEGVYLAPLQLKYVSKSLDRSVNQILRSRLLPFAMYSQLPEARVTPYESEGSRGIGDGPGINF